LPWQTACAYEILAEKLRGAIGMAEIIAVAQFFGDFSQVSDQAVAAILQKKRTGNFSRQLARLQYLTLQLLVLPRLGVEVRLHFPLRIPARHC
jgi:hypothetical protein